MIRLLALVLLSLVALPAHAQQNRIPRSTVANLGAFDCPANSSPGPANFCLVVDGTDAQDCSVGGGSLEVFCLWDGAAWRSLYDNQSLPVAESLGDALTPAVTITTDGVGDGELTLPENAIGVDELGPVGERQALFCGGLPNNTANFAGPQSGFATAPALGGSVDLTLGSLACGLLDSLTEATADEVMYVNVPVKVHDLYCRVTGAGANGVTFAVRSATANLTPNITCTVPTGGSDCHSALASTTDVGAGATVAVRAATTENLALQAYQCTMAFSLR